jgi:hypothetical protein
LYVFFLGNSTASEVYIPTFRNTLSVPSSEAGRCLYNTHLSAYEDGTECSETSVYKLQTPENYPEESKQHSEHGESLKSRTLIICLGKAAKINRFQFSYQKNRFLCLMLSVKLQTNQFVSQNCRFTSVCNGAFICLIILINISCREMRFHSITFLTSCAWWASYTNIKHILNNQPDACNSIHNQGRPRK